MDVPDTALTEIGIAQISDETKNNRNRFGMVNIFLSCKVVISLQA